MRPDIETACWGSIITIAPTTPAGYQWLAEHVDGGCSGGRIDAEARFAVEIMVAAIEAGLVLCDAATGRTAMGKAQGVRA